ncbi:MAG: tetratricopeptide repeat protein [Candidatus Omnitrophota bacterium]
MKLPQRWCMALAACSFLYIIPPAASLPLTKEQLFQMATVAAASNQFDQSEELFKKVLEIDPKFAPAYNGLGLINQTMGPGNMDEAIRYFTLATSMAPEYAESWNNLGRACYSKGRFFDAKQAFMKSLQINSDQPDVSFALGWVYLLGESRPGEAIDCFDKALAVKDNSLVYYGRGLAHMMLGDRFKVLDDITELRKRKSEEQANLLEKMVRDNIRLISTPGTVLMTGLSGDEVSLFDEQLKALEAKGFNSRSTDGIKVRLKGSSPVY